MTNSNEQLRGAMMTLVASYNRLENNLERHEIRERALGEVVKKALQTLQKGQRIIEPIRASFTRLDERIGQVETLLIGRDTELRDQQTLAATGLRSIQQLLAERDIADAADRVLRQQQHDQLLAAIRAQPAAFAAAATTNANGSDDDDDDDDRNVGKKIDDLADAVKRLRQEVAELAADRGHADVSLKTLLSHAELAQTSAAAAAADGVTTALHVGQLKQQITGLSALTEQLANSSSRATDAPGAERLQATLGTIEHSLNTLLSRSATAAGEASREFCAGQANETLAAIGAMRIEVLGATERSSSKTAERIREAVGTLDESIADAVRTISEADGNNSTASAAQVCAQLNERTAAGYAELRADVAGLRQLERILLDTGNNVLAVKRGLEYNVHTVTLEIGELVGAHVAGLNDTLTEQFGRLNETIRANHNGALANLTAKIETEISQVWRQIGIMFHMVQSTEMSLNKLQEQTEIYVNGTSAVMDGMGGKVWDIYIYMYTHRCCIEC